MIKEIKPIEKIKVDNYINCNLTALATPKLNAIAKLNTTNTMDNKSSTNDVKLASAVEELALNTDETEQIDVEATAQDDETYDERTIIKKIDFSELKNKIIIPRNKTHSGAQAIALVRDKIIVTRSSDDPNEKTCIDIIDKNTKKVIREIEYDFAHAGGITYNPYTNKIYVKPNEEGTILKYVDANELINGENATIKEFDLGKNGSGIAYDAKTNKYYSNNRENGTINVFDNNLKYESSISLTRNQKNDQKKSNMQDMAAYNGVGMVVYYNKKAEISMINGIDFYDLKTKEYMGTYELPSSASTGENFEIESLEYAGIDDDFLVLMNIKGTSEEQIYTININVNDLKN